MAKGERSDPNALRAEYEALMARFAEIGAGTNSGIALAAAVDAARHILKRLGPPDPEASDVDEFKAEDWA